LPSFRHHRHLQIGLGGQTEVDPVPDTASLRVPRGAVQRAERLPPRFATEWPLDALRFGP